MRVSKVIGMFAVAVMVATGASAQSAKTPQTDAQKGRQMMMSMEDMTKQCRDHCTKASKSMDDTMKMMNDAKTSNDATKMRTALDQTQKQMTEMKEHMTMCMNMMDMMQKMAGDTTKKK